jgi:hypothetical protein
MHSGFVILRGKNGQFYFHFRGRGGEKILNSDAYLTKSCCEEGISDLKVFAWDKKWYEKRVTYDHRYYFVIKNAEGKILATSEYFSYSFSRDNAMMVVKEFVAFAPVRDQS